VVVSILNQSINAAYQVKQQTDSHLAASFPGQPG